MESWREWRSSNRNLETTTAWNPPRLGVNQVNGWNESKDYELVRRNGAPVSGPSCGVCFLAGMGRLQFTKFGSSADAFDACSWCTLHCTQVEGSCVASVNGRIIECNKCQSKKWKLEKLWSREKSLFRNPSWSTPGFFHSPLVLKVLARLLRILLQLEEQTAAWDQKANISISPWQSEKRVQWWPLCPSLF